MYDSSNTIFCLIASALTKHPVASHILTHNSKRLAYMLTAQLMIKTYMEVMF